MQKARAIRKSREDWIFDIVNYTFITLLVFITFYPMYYVAIASFSDPATVSQSGGLMALPTGIQWDAYRRVFANGDIWTGYLNTVIYTFVGTALNIVLTCGLAFALSRKSLFFKKPLTKFVMFTMFFNGGMIPTFLTIRQLGLLNTRFAVLLPGLVSVFNFIIVRTNFESIPDSLEESAHLDGANEWQILWKIVLPLSMPIIAVMVLFYGVNHWNSWFNEMLYLPNARGLWPLALITREIIVNTTSSMAEGSTMTAEFSTVLRYATIMVSTLPILCLYPFLQKYFVKGVMVGAVKG